MGINRFKDFINTITFGIFCKDKYDVTITAADETTTAEETTATPSNAEEETTASGGSSSVTGDISVGIWIMILFVSGTLVVYTLWFGKKREEA